MTPSEVKQLRRVLEARQAELEEVLRDRELIAVNTSADLFDQIQHATERDLAIGNLERDSSRLREVRAALARTPMFTIRKRCKDGHPSERAEQMRHAMAFLAG